MCEILVLGSGIKPAFLPLAGRFFTTEPLGKSVVYFLKEKENLCASVHGIFQARILQWVAISFSRGFPHPRIELESFVSLALQMDYLPVEPLG